MALALILLSTVAGAALAMPPMPPMMYHECNATFGEWETSEKCVWPTEAKAADLPNSCKNIPPKPEKMPEVVYKFLQGKYSDYYNMWAVETKARGMKGSCGMCGFKLKCRMQTTPPKTHFCPPKEKVFIYDSECQKEEPCELSLKDGGCESPESSELFHFMTVLAALGKGVESDLREIEIGHKLEQFMEMMIGVHFEAGGKMKGKGKGKGHGPPMGGDMGMEDIKKGFDQLKGLVDKGVGKAGDKDFTEVIKQLMSEDGAGTDKIKDVLETFTQIFNNRRRRQAVPPPGADELAENESYIAPTMNCVSNKEGTKCICCCNWHIPDRETGKCVEVREDLIAFVKSIAPPPPPPGSPLDIVSHPVADLLGGL